MNPFDTIEKWIKEHGSASILRDHVALLKEQMSNLERENLSLKVKLHNTETERDDYKNKADGFADEQPAETCPYCHRATLRLIEIKPNPNPHFAMMGFKQRYYKCGNPSCGQAYDKSVNPEG
jgi:hypothetical protein